MGFSVSRGGSRMDLVVNQAGMALSLRDKGSVSAFMNTIGGYPEGFVNSALEVLKDKSESMPFTIKVWSGVLAGQVSKSGDQFEMVFNEMVFHTSTPSQLFSIMLQRTELNELIQDIRDYWIV